jgi:hypothetical protein
MKGEGMRRTRAIVVAIVAVIGMVGAGMLAAGAQDATPPGVIEIAPGVTADQVVIFEGRETPSLYRLHFAPGVSYTVEPSDSLELAYIEAGTLTITLDAPTMRGTVGDPGAEELVPANTEVSLESGTYFILQPATGGTVRNDGQEPTIVSVAGVLPVTAATPPA